jgi:hypothetical protein
VHESTDSSEQDHNQKEQDKEKDSSGKDGVSKEDFAGAGEVLASAANSVVRAKNTLGEFGSTFIPTIALPKASGGGGKRAEFKPIERGLNAEEKRGAWVLAGVVGLGLLLGGPKKDKKSGSSLKDKASQAADKVKGAAGLGGGVKGDEKWAKASGAEVVGHGTRKA